MTEDMERLHSNLSGAAVQLAHFAAQTAELAVQIGARRARQAEQTSAQAASQVGARLRADRALAATVWARAQSQKWLRIADSDEVVTVWASARAWAPHDPRASRALDRIIHRLVEFGIPAGPATVALDARDAAAFQRLLDSRPRPAGTRTGSTDHRERDARITAALRSAWAPSTVDAVFTDDAWPAFAAKLDRLPAEELSSVLRVLPHKQIAGPDIRNPAAFAAWSLDNVTAARAARIASEGFTAPAAHAVAAAVASGGGTPRSSIQAEPRGESHPRPIRTRPAVTRPTDHVRTDQPDR